MHARPAPVALAVALLASGCYCSHLPPEAVPTSDAGTDAGRSDLDASIRYPTVVGCSDPLLWERAPSGALAIEQPLECVPFREPLHAFVLWPALGVDPPEVARSCWRVVREEGSGWTFGTITETATPSLSGYVRGGHREIELEARLQLADGRLLVGAGGYRARDSGVTDERVLERAPIALSYAGHADAIGIHARRVLALEGLRAMTALSTELLLVWVRERDGARVLGTWQAGAADDGTEIPLATDAPLRFAGSHRQPQPWAVATTGERATVVRWDRDTRTTRTSSFVLGVAPDAIGIRGEVLLVLAGGELRAWSIEGVPLSVADLGPVETVVVGPLGDFVQRADGSLAAPLVSATGVEGLGAVHAVDPALGRVLAASDDLWIGEHGLERAPLDGGPTLHLLDPVTEGTITHALIDSYYGTSTFVVARDGIHTLHSTEPSYEGCD